MLKLSSLTKYLNLKLKLAVVGKKDVEKKSVIMY